MPRQFGKVDASARWPSCPQCRRRHESGSECPPIGQWVGQGGTSAPMGVVWLKRPMPDGQWPPDQRAPRDDSFSWWVRSHCGHEGGARQWAFYDEAVADQYEQIFRDDPCHYTHCKIKNYRRR